MSPPFPESETSKSPAANSLMASSLAEKVMNIAGVYKCQGRILHDQAAIVNKHVSKFDCTI